MSATVAPRACLIEGCGGLPLNVWDYGGRGPEILLSHCTGGLGRLWDGTAALLRDEWRVLAPDTRGHGLSGRPPCQAECRWEWSGRDLLAAADALAAGKTLRAAGHSAGGAHLVYAELARPGTFSRLALIDPIIGPETMLGGPGRHALEEQARRRVKAFPSRDEALARLGNKPPYARWAPEVQAAFFQHGFEEDAQGMVRLRCRPEIEAWCYAEGGGFDIFGRLRELTPEILLVSGAESNLLELVREQARQLPHATLEIVQGATHFVPQEQPERLAALLRAWFS